MTTNSSSVTAATTVYGNRCNGYARAEKRSVWTIGVAAEGNASATLITSRYASRNRRLGQIQRGRLVDPKLHDALALVFGHELVEDFVAV